MGEEKRRVPEPSEIVKKISASLLERGGDCLLEHGYVWGQTEAVIHLFVPARGIKIERTSDVSCDIHAKSFSIALPTKEGTQPFELKGDLHKPIRPDDCSWQLEDGGRL